MERRSSLVDSALDSGGAWFQSFFSGFGRFVYKFGAVTFVVMSLFLVGISFGLLDAREETRISELWVEEGTRLRDERQAVIDRWGPGGRLELIAFEHVSGGNLGTKAMLDQMLAVLNPIMNNVGDGKIEFNATIQGVTSSYNILDLCDTPPVPTLFGVGPSALANLGANQFITYGYKTLTSCLHTTIQAQNAAGLSFLTNGGFYNVIPADWGVDRFPCTRLSPLDCFVEGNFDYPTNMKLVDGMGFILKGLFDNTTTTLALMNGIIQAVGTAGGVPQGTITASFFSAAHFTAITDAAAQCKTNLNNQIDALVTNPQQNAAVKAFARDQSLTIFAGFGYKWRKSYTSLSTETRITDAIINAYIFTSSASNGLEQCVGASLADPTGTTTCCLAWSGTKTPFQLVYGDVNRNVGSRRIGAFRAVINLWGEGSPIFEQRLTAKLGGSIKATQDEQAEVLQLWEQKFIDYMLPFWQKTYSGASNNPNLAIKFIADRSIADIVEEGKNPESHLVIVGYITLLVYSCLTLITWTGDFKSSLIESSAIVAVAGIIIIMLSTVAGFGLVTILGYDLSPISTNLVPFLSLGIGVDDMFVLIHTLRDHKHYPDAATRIEQSMSIAGPSVFLTSITNACAFFVATLTPIPAVKTFVFQMGLTTLLNLLSLLMMFVPVLVWDTHRHINGKPDCLLCCFDGDSNYQSQVDSSDSVVKRFTNNYYAPALKHPIGKIVVLSVFLALFAVLAYLGFAKVETGMRQSDIALRDSYQREYAKLNEDVFGSFSASLVTLTKTTDFTTASPNKQQTILDIMANLQASPYVSTDITVKDLAWLADGQTTLLYTALQAGVTGTANTPMNPALFNTIFQQWITTVGATSVGNFYCVVAATGVRSDCAAFNPSTDKVEAARQTIFNDNLIEHDNFIDTIEDNRARVDAIDPVNSFMYGYIYQYWEQYLNIRNNLYTIVGWALLGVFLATFVFQFSPVTSLLVAITILMIVIEVYGTMYLIPVKLNAFSVVNLVMSVGLAVEFTAHISHVFLMKRGTRNDRMTAALDELMTPMLHGAVSSLLAVLVLAFARFPFFRDYYFSMFAVMIILSFANGMIFLPVVLSLIGPASFSYAETTNDKDVQLHTVKSSTDVRDDTLDNTTL